VKKILLGIIIGLLAGGVGVWTVLERREHAEGGEEKKEAHPAPSHVQHGTNGETILKLDAAVQAKIGLKIVALEAADRKPEVKAIGHVIDPAPIAASLAEVELAKAQLEGSTRELERLKILFQQNQNVSARAVEAAEVAARRDKLAWEAARVRFASAGSAITEMKELEAFVRSAVAQRAALIRVELPAGEATAGAVVGGRIAFLQSADRPMEAEFLGPAPNVDPQGQGQGFLFAVRTNGFAANAAVLAWLALAGDVEHGVVVPSDAIVRHEGEPCVYLQTSEDTFARKEVELEHPAGKGWFTDALKPDTRIVVTGAQQLLSEEFKGPAEEGE
jgi:hypothetical protein